MQLQGALVIAPVHGIPKRDTGMRHGGKDGGNRAMGAKGEGGIHQRVDGTENPAAARR